MVKNLYTVLYLVGLMVHFVFHLIKRNLTALSLHFSFLRKNFSYYFTKMFSFGKS